MSHLPRLPLQASTHRNPKDDQPVQQTRNVYRPRYQVSTTGQVETHKASKTRFVHPEELRISNNVPPAKNGAVTDTHPAIDL